MSRVLLLAILVSIGASACERTASPSTQEGPGATRFEELRITTPDSIELYVRVVGTGPDTVIVGLAAWLARDLTPLAAGRTLIFYDPRSRGGSDAVLDPGRLGIDLEVEDIEAVRAHFGIGQVSLIGWSYLGAVVALYAARYPDFVRSVVQVGPMPPRRPSSRVSEIRGSPPSAADRDYLASLGASGLPESDPVAYCREVVLRQMLRPMLGRPEAAADALSDPCMYWNEWPAQLFATVPKVIPQEDWDYSGEAAAVRAPVLTVHGTNDPNAPIEGGREWVSLLPNARLIELEGVGHGPWLEAPSEFFEVIGSFLRAH